MLNWKSLNALRLAAVHPELAARVNKTLDCMEAAGTPVLVTQGLRTMAEQAALYAQGRAASGQIVTHAQAGFSSHNFGLAVDVVPLTQAANPEPDWNVQHPAWRHLLSVAKTYGLAEGAEFRTFPDFPHLYLKEFSDTPSEAMRTAFNKGGLSAVFAAVSQALAAVTAEPLRPVDVIDGSGAAAVKQQP